jgi:hypothetical protein
VGEAAVVFFGDVFCFFVGGARVGASWGASLSFLVKKLVVGGYYIRKWVIPMDRFG